MHAKVKPVWKWITRNDPVKIFVVVVVLAFSFLSWYFSFRYPASLVSTRVLDPYNNASAVTMLRHCWDAIHLTPVLRSYTIALPIPAYVGYINLGGEIVQIADWYPLTEPYLQYYIVTVDANGTANYSDSSTWIVSEPNININNDPQMQRCAANPDESFWNLPYIFPPSPNEVWIAFVKPVRDFFTGEYSGVVSSDFTVTSIGEYLSEIKPTPNTKSMITDSDFNVIANSDPGNETVTFSATPVAATSLEDETLREAALQLPSIYAKMNKSGETTVRTSFKHKGKQLLLVKRVVNLNLDWLVVVVVPNSDFFHGKKDYHMDFIDWNHSVNIEDPAGSQNVYFKNVRFAEKDSYWSYCHCLCGGI